MNPIIKQLAEQAGMNIKTNVIGTALVFGTFEGYKTSHITVEELEKFAKLIVQECCGVADTLHLYLPTMTAKKLIVRHFGVEP